MKIIGKPNSGSLLQQELDTKFRIEIIEDGKLKALGGIPEDMVVTSQPYPFRGRVN